MLCRSACINPGNTRIRASSNAYHARCTYVQPLSWIIYMLDGVVEVCWRTACFRSGTVRVRLSTTGKEEEKKRGRFQTRIILRKRKRCIDKLVDIRRVLCSRVSEYAAAVAILV